MPNVSSSFHWLMSAGSAALESVTFTTKVSVALKAPSETVTAMTTVPDWLGAGVTFTVRLEPLPAKVMFAFGTRV